MKTLVQSLNSRVLHLCKTPCANTIKRLMRKTDLRHSLTHRVPLVAFKRKSRIRLRYSQQNTVWSILQHRIYACTHEPEVKEAGLMYFLCVCVCVFLWIIHINRIRPKKNKKYLWTSVLILKYCVYFFRFIWCVSFTSEEKNKLLWIVVLWKPPSKTMSQSVVRQTIRHGWKIFCNGKKNPRGPREGVELIPGFPE